jgi:8-oxo-dGTP diphosphatase
VAVVGAAIIRDGLVFCARRASGEIAGLWEFPGGKVDPGETPEQALKREIAEELGVSISVGEKIAVANVETPKAQIELTTYFGTIIGSQEPQLSDDHDDSRWLAPQDLLRLNWAEADIPTAQALAFSADSEDLGSKALGGRGASGGRLKPLFIIIGFLSLTLGLIGIAIPVLPTTPFVLLAAACFARSSPKFLAALQRNRVFGPYLENYKNGTGIPGWLKTLTLCFLWAGLTISMILVRERPWLTALLAAIGIAVTIHVSTIKTKR